ncbi:MAG: DUF5103 domain-containing protein [Prevotellaceae bacterium]|jgi:hypothetical protein|nr:DUF5103 domain-containing protein [Prevotellaceae bacterium]
MKNTTLLILCLLANCYAGIVAQTQYRTETLQNNVRTLQIAVSGNRFALPVMELGGEGRFTISFDELTANIKNYDYTIQHCNADWTPSDLSSSEWCSGFETNPVENVRSSINTLMSYNHYSFSFPNENINFKLSGNYVVKIHEANQPETIIATACFSLVETKIGIEATVRGNTDVEINRRKQQVDFSLVAGNYLINNPAELSVIVRQNNRTDNEVRKLEPTYISRDRLTYSNNKALIFDGGNEYRSIDFSSLYSYGMGITKIRYYEPYYHVELDPATIVPRSAPYSLIDDVNGRFVINLQESDDDDLTADYFLVHFSIPADEPYFDGQLFILGELNYNKLDNSVRMDYNTQNKQFEQTVLLKQGGYNYLFVFRPEGSTAASAERIENSYWQTRNEYSIYVYHRPFGERYDRLIAVRTLQSGQ